MPVQGSFAQAEFAARVGRESTLSKVNALVDWERLRPLCEGLHKREQREVCKGGQKPFDGVMLFKALLLGQWHSLSDPKLEQALRVRLDFMQFCELGFDDAVPDESTLCRARNRLIEAGRMEKLLSEVNAQLQGHGLMMRHAAAAIVDATLIPSAARPHRGRWLIEGEVPTQSEADAAERAAANAPNNTTTQVPQTQMQTEVVAQEVQSADPDARWVKKGSLAVHGYRGYIAVDDEDGYVRGVHSAPANGCEMHHFAPTVEAADFAPQRVYADKGFSSKANRTYLRARKIKSAIMHKGLRNKPLNARQKSANVKMSKTRWRVEQAFGTIKRIFGFTRASYFTTVKFNAQLAMKSMCLNLLKAANKVRGMEMVGEPQTTNIPKLRALIT